MGAHSAFLRRYFDDLVRVLSDMPLDEISSLVDKLLRVYEEGGSSSSQHTMPIFQF